jgi:hypothetical protein
MGFWNTAKLEESNDAPHDIVARLAHEYQPTFFCCIRNIRWQIVHMWSFIEFTRE